MERRPHDVRAQLLQAGQQAGVGVEQPHPPAEARERVRDATTGPEGDVALVRDATRQDDDVGRCAHPVLLSVVGQRRSGGGLATERSEGDGVREPVPRKERTSSSSPFTTVASRCTPTSISAGVG